jgi:hypothetical protein
MRVHVAATASLLVAACVSTNVQQVDHTVRAPRSPDSVEVLEEAPSQAYTVIATIEANTETVFDSFDDLRSEMVAEAAKLGGDALILGPEATDSEFIFTGTAMVQSDTRRLSGEVIVYEQG